MASEEELVRENILGCLQATLLPAPLSVALRSSSVVSRLNSNHSGGLCLRCRTSNRMSESPGVRLCRSGVRRENVALGEVDAGAEPVVDPAHQVVLGSRRRRRRLQFPVVRAGRNFFNVACTMLPVWCSAAPPALPLIQN